MEPDTADDHAIDLGHKKGRARNIAVVLRNICKIVLEVVRGVFLHLSQMLWVTFVRVCHAFSEESAESVLVCGLGASDGHVCHCWCAAYHFSLWFQRQSSTARSVLAGLWALRSITRVLHAWYLLPPVRLTTRSTWEGPSRVLTHGFFASDCLSILKHAGDAGYDVNANLVTSRVLAKLHEEICAKRAQQREAELHTAEAAKMQRVARFLRLFDGKPDAIPPVKTIFRLDGSSTAYSASVHTDREWGGRSRATFRVGNAGASGSGVCGVFEGFIDKAPSLVPNAAGVTGRRGFAMLQLKSDDADAGSCEEYDALALRASGDGRLYSVSLRNAVPLAPNIAYQGFLARERRGWRTYELPFTSFAATLGGRVLDQPRILDVARFSSLSIAVADDLEGPFRLEISGVRALREDDGGLG